MLHLPRASSINTTSSALKKIPRVCSWSRPCCPVTGELRGPAYLACCTALHLRGGPCRRNKNHLRRPTTPLPVNRLAGLHSIAVEYNSSRPAVSVCWLMGILTVDVATFLLKLASPFNTTGQRRSKDAPLTAKVVCGRMVSAYRTAASGNALCTGRASSDRRLMEICPLCRSYFSVCTYGDVNQCSSPEKHTHRL